MVITCTYVCTMYIQLFQVWASMETILVAASNSGYHFIVGPTCLHGEYFYNSQKSNL